MAVTFDIQSHCDSLKQGLKKALADSPPLRLVSLAVGRDFSAQTYRTSQERMARELGVDYQAMDLPGDISFPEFKAAIETLSRDPGVTGIILNKPFPAGVSDAVAFSCLSAKKDPEGMHPLNLGKFFMGDDALMPPTARSVKEILEAVLEEKGESCRGKRITVVGFSPLCGKPLVFWLGNNLATVSLTHIATYESGDLPFYVRNADILISAVGKPEVIKGEWIKEAAIVIDVGVSKKDNKITGDVEFAAARSKAAFITPVPGGVGRLTVFFLFENLWKLSRL